MDRHVSQGKALVMAIQGLNALGEAEVKVSILETDIRPQLIKAYQRELKAIIARISPEAAAEVLMAMKGTGLPTIDPGVN